MNKLGHRRLAKECRDTARMIYHSLYDKKLKRRTRSVNRKKKSS